jgi:hypothetical protein
MRKEADEASEMVNQVLFGESFSVIEENKPKNFSFIRLDHDKYEGWVNSKCIHFLTKKEWEVTSKLPVAVSHEFSQTLQGGNSEFPMVIGCGSILRLSSPGKTRIGKIELSIPEIPENTTKKTREKLVNYGSKLISIPYLWGGRSSFGFDCSGLCQNLYRQVGIEIPRDASAQASVGFSLNFIGEALPGDLVFFDNDEGKIIHVGMIIGDSKIIHASGRVKVDSLDHQGIFSKEQNRYTHVLRLIRRVVV